MADGLLAATGRITLVPRMLFLFCLFPVRSLSPVGWHGGDLALRVQDHLAGMIRALFLRQIP